MTELVKAAVLNAVKLNSSAVNVVVAKQLGSKYPNMNKINNMLTNSIEQVQQMDAILQGSEHGDQNPLTNLINTLVAQAALAKKPIEQPDNSLHKKLDKIFHVINDQSARLTKLESGV